MAISKQYRPIFQENGKDYIFAPKVFREYVLKMRQLERINTNKSQADILNEIANKVNKSFEAVRNWMRGYNGPSDINVVKDIADYFKMDFRIFLMETSEIISNGNSVVELHVDNTDEVGIIKQFYQLFVDFLFLYMGDDDGNCYALRHSESGYIVDELEEYVFNLRWNLDKMALLISDDTYNKISKYIDFCVALGQVGTMVAPFWEIWLENHPDWLKVNPRLEVAVKYSKGDFDSAMIDYLDKEDKDMLVGEFNKNVGVTMWDNPIGEKTCDEYYYHMPYEVIPMELTRAFTILYKHDFKKLLI